MLLIAILRRFLEYIDHTAQNENYDLERNGHVLFLSTIPEFERPVTVVARSKA
jgi:hypothetical protein